MVAHTSKGVNHEIKEVGDGRLHFSHNGKSGYVEDIHLDLGDPLQVLFWNDGVLTPFVSEGIVMAILP